MTRTRHHTGRHGPLTVLQFPCLRDNYGFLLRCEETGVVAAVDTPEIDPIAREVDGWGGRLDLVLNTHWHPDHTGGNEALKARYGAEIVGPTGERDRIPGLDRASSEGDTVAVGALSASVLGTEGHTAGHVSYHFEGQNVAFVGDTLFSLGCGRLFEGTAEQMWGSLSKLRALPGETVIYCAHEYTRANADFAIELDPGNERLRARSAEIDRQRGDDLPTVPVTLADERDVNPFLRGDDPVMAALVGMEGAAPSAVFGEIRARKDAA